MPLDLEALNAEFAFWLGHKANARVHGTTGEVPAERLVVEQAALQPMPRRRLGGGLVAPPTKRSVTSAFALEALQHPLSVYDALLETI